MQHRLIGRLCRMQLSPAAHVRSISVTPAGFNVMWRDSQLTRVVSDCEIVLGLVDDGSEALDICCGAASCFQGKIKNFGTSRSATVGPLTKFVTSVTLGPPPQSTQLATPSILQLAGLGFVSLGPFHCADLFVFVCICVFFVSYCIVVVSL